MSRFFYALALLWLPTTAASSPFLEVMTAPPGDPPPDACGSGPTYPAPSKNDSYCPSSHPWNCGYSLAPHCVCCNGGWKREYACTSTACVGDYCVICPIPPTPPPTPPTYDCEVTPTSKSCVAKHDGKGGFPTLGACQANPMCDPTTYACLVNKTFTGCVKTPAGQGPFPTLAACNKTCTPPVPAPGQ
jgi:hypothetical protein